MSTNQILGIVIAAVIIILGAWYLLTPHSAATPETNTTDMSGMDMGQGTAQGATATSTTITTTTTTTTTSASTGVSYSASGFSPASVSIAEGGTVTWTNHSAQMLWVATDPHPAHTGYDGTSRDTHCAAGYTGPAPFDACTGIAPGASWSFTFTKAGSWGYHNHLSPEDTGTVVVTAS
jgi:plastocyanin